MSSSKKDADNFDSERYLEGVEKFQVKTVYNKDYFLPALACFIELFTPSSSIRTMIKTAEKHTQLSSEISDSSLDNLSRQGVGKKTAEKLFRFFFRLNPKLFNQLDSLCDMTEAVYENDNYWKWLGTIHALKAREDQENDELSLSIAFLEKRCQQSKQLNIRCREQWEKKQETPELLAFYCDEANRHTLLDGDDLKALQEGIDIAQNKDGSAIPRDSAVSLLQYRLDFYFHLMATLEVGILRSWLEFDENIQNRVPDLYLKGIFCGIAGSQGQSSPFNHFLDTLKERLNPSVLKGGSPLSDYKLATHIPLQKADEQYVTQHEAQKRQLRKWREGNEYPSLDTLEAMISHLFGFKDQTPIIARSLALIGFFCIGMDRLHKQLLEDKEITAELLDKAYASYPRYWQNYRNGIWDKAGS